MQTVLTALEATPVGTPDDIETLLRAAASSARTAIVEEAAEEESELHSYATTLLIAFLSPVEAGALQIGDGVIAVNSEENWCWVFWPQKGEYANTTRFLTDTDALDRAEVVRLREGVVDVAMMSDGLESLALHYATRSLYEPFFNGAIAPLVQAKGCAEIQPLSSSLEHFLSSESVTARTDDDVSLILATLR